MAALGELAARVASLERTLASLARRQRAECEELRDNFAILLDFVAVDGRFADRGFATHNFSKQLHRQRFESARRRFPCSFDKNLVDILQLRELSLQVLQTAGLPAVRVLRCASRTASGRSPNKREASVMFPECLCVAGGTNGQSALCSVERFRPSSGTWDALPPMRLARSGAAGVVLDGRVQLWGGFGGGTAATLDSPATPGGFLKNAEQFDPALGQWVEVRELLAPRGGAAAAAVDGKGYIFAGFDGEQELNEAERLVPSSGSWETLPPLLQRRSGAVASVVAGKIYVCGGFDGSIILGSVERFNPFSNTWQAAPSMSTGRRDAGCAAVAGRLYVCGGFDGAERLASVERFDPMKDTWESLPDMSARRTGAAVAALKDKVYVCGGFDGSDRLSSVERFNVQIGVWEQVTPMSSKRAGAVALVFRV